MRTIAVLVILTACPAAAQGQDSATGEAAPYRIDETRAFSTDGNLRIMLLEGSVRVRTWDRDSVRVAGTLDPAARRGFYFAATEGGAGKLGVETSREGRAELEVTLPSGTRLWVKTAGAPIEVSGVAAAMDLYSVTGGIRVDGSPRSVYAESMGGNLRLEGSPQVARLRTGAGRVEVRGGVPDLSVTTVNGEVTVAGTSPLRRVLVETVGGAVRIEGALESASALSVTSHDGPVDLVVPPSTDAEFLVVTLEGEVHNLLTRGGTRKTTGLRGRELSFTSGSGDAEVTVRTFSGVVTIRPGR